MSVATLKKRPSERFPIGFKFSEPELAEGETVVGAEVTVYPIEAGGLEKLGDPVITEDTAVQMVDSGVDGHDYYVKFLVTTSVGNIFEGTILVFVREVIPQGGD
jgi:hypothetical protein